MKVSKIATAVVLSGAVVLAIAVWMQSGPAATAGTEMQEDGRTMQEDARTAILLPASARIGVLGEMRQMLSALNGVLAGAAAKDTARMAEAARSGGMVMAVDMDPGLMGLLPEEFRKLGMSTHLDFDALAERIGAGQPLDTVLVRLVRLTDKCVACHAIYRLEVAEPD